ncbi:tripartite tricarboxylate transporter TctB family protein [Agrobacterium sp. LAD9]|uniref:tripartite tricarboxylate transporter TctB family protein n=1 Tax=Agrobacterium sp. LAD9 TaxID=2055153 RepID=UPI000D1FD2F1|nr:tripartite tricarboxylate transporter TctB family protein [Agrobacterium sp. LAD9]
MKVNAKDLTAGVFFIAFGSLYAGITLKSLHIGGSSDIGPGYFPIITSTLLVLSGIVVAFRSLGVQNCEMAGQLPWRGILCIFSATIFFASFISILGLFPTVFLTTLVAAYADPKTRIVRALTTSLGIASFCTLTFGYGLGLPVAIFSFPWGI